MWPSGKNNVTSLITSAVEVASSSTFTIYRNALSVIVADKSMMIFCILRTPVFVSPSIFGHFVMPNVRDLGTRQFIFSASGTLFVMFTYVSDDLYTATKRAKHL